MAAQICGSEARSLWTGGRDKGIAVEVIGLARTSCATVELHDVVFHAEAESDGPSEHALFDLSLTARGGEAVGRFPELGGGPQRRLGELLFIPPRTRFYSRWQRGSQRTLWVVPHGGAGWAEQDWRAAALDDALDMRSGELRGAMLRLAAELAHPGYASGLMIEALCTEVLVLLQRHLRLGSPAADLSPPDSRALGAVQMRRIEDLAEAAGPVPGLAELAGACGLSERHFSRLFRSATGQSAARFIHDRRLARARERLACSGTPIKQIAWEAGFESPAAFTVAFRRFTGRSPREFRRLSRS